MRKVCILTALMFSLNAVQAQYIPPTPMPGTNYWTDATGNHSWFDGNNWSLGHRPTWNESVAIVNNINIIYVDDDNGILVGFGGASGAVCKTLSMEGQVYFYRYSFSPGISISISNDPGARVSIYGPYTMGTTTIHGVNIQVNGNEEEELLAIENQALVLGDIQIMRGKAKIRDSYVRGFNYNNNLTGIIRNYGGELRIFNTEIGGSDIILANGSSTWIENSQIKKTGGFNLIVLPAASFYSSNFNIDVRSEGTSGTSIGIALGGHTLHGNIYLDATNAVSSNGYLIFNNPSYLAQSGIGPCIINGNIELAPGASGTLPLVNLTDLKISGNIISKGPYASNAELQIHPPYAPIEFFGSQNSYIKWPSTFRLPALTVNKDNCAKLYADDSPLTVFNLLLIKKGQLVLNPNPGLQYKLETGANLIIEDGGSMVLNKDANGNISNLLVGGDFTDKNTITDINSCKGFINENYANIDFYDFSNNFNPPPQHTVEILHNSNLGNINLDQIRSYPLHLKGNITVNNLDFGNCRCIVVLNDYSLKTLGSISNYNNNRFVVANGTGSLIQPVANNTVVYPLGVTSSSYTPVSIVNTGTTDNFKVRVQQGVLSNGTSGALLTSKAVDRTWLIEEEIAGGSNANISVQWNAVEEMTGFNRVEANLGHYNGSNWNLGNLTTAQGSNPYSITRNDITSFSPFAVLGPNAVSQLVDADGDGYNVSQDCNDNNIAIYPGAAEVCDGLDNNCDAQIDEGVNTTFYRDADSDGFGNLSSAIQACSLPAGYVTNSTDCKDTDASIYPASIEMCDGKDNDCDGIIDEGFNLKTYYVDNDRDGFYAGTTASVQACSQPLGYAGDGGDCDDNNPAVFPRAIEVCDGLDNDCNGVVDERCTTTPAPSILIEDATAYEAEREIKVMVKLSFASTQEIRVRYLTSNGTATMPKDYSRVSGELIFVPGQTAKTISINIVNDNWVEHNEYFKVQLKNAVNANLSDDIAFVTIKDGSPLLYTTNARTTSITQASTKKPDKPAAKFFDIKASPNPSNKYFILKVESNNPKEVIKVRVLDISGRVKETKANVGTGEILELGNNYKPGVYIVEVMQGNNKKQLKLIKL